MLFVELFDSPSKACRSGIAKRNPQNARMVFIQINDVNARMAFIGCKIKEYSMSETLFSPVGAICL